MTAEFANSIVLWRHPLSLSASGQLSGERSCKSAPSCFKRGFDGGKKIRGVKVHLGVEKHGIPLAIDVSPANVHDTKGIVPVLRELAGQGFRGSALGDLGYRGKRLAKAGQKLGITVKPIARSATESSFQLESVGWWSGPTPGFHATVGLTSSSSGPRSTSSLSSRSLSFPSSPGA